MLIKCDRHTQADLDYWGELEQADLAYYLGNNMRYREEAAIAAIRRFEASGPFFIGVSWGKDSVTCLHLAIRAVDNPVALCSRGTYQWRAHNVLFLEDVKMSFPIGNYRYYEITYPEWPPHSKEKSFDEWKRKNRIYKHLSGIRSTESGSRNISRHVHGVCTDNTCRPIIDWPTEAVFAYAAHYNLPLHPNYGMLGGGRWDRNMIRVGGSIGMHMGDGMGRREWEREYYQDIINRIEYNRLQRSLNG